MYIRIHVIPNYSSFHQGLYDLALSRWESMVSVAQWLVSRIVLKRTERKQEFNSTSEIVGSVTASNQSYSPDMIELTVNRKVELPVEARKQWKGILL
jgi:hypothetical protein